MPLNVCFRMKEREPVTQVTVELPEFLAKLPPAEREPLIVAGIYEAARARRGVIQKEIEDANEYVQRFETRYGASFDQFESEYLAGDDSPQVHEDYNDWFFWSQVLERNRALLEQMTRDEESEPLCFLTADSLVSLTGVVALGGNAVDDVEALYDGE